MLTENEDSSEDEDIYHSISPDNASIIVAENGTKSLYVDNVFWFELTDEMSKSSPFNALPIHQNNH
ncbi:hypothetical protein LJC32_02080 [Oscillospiraceae bacterium OttesenSCG-928-F05]|nr:hypothetical protein [Oscillospiraceae bacterium OttesenSCG-928-F05]